MFASFANTIMIFTDHLCSVLKWHNLDVSIALHYASYICIHFDNFFSDDILMGETSSSRI